MSSSELYGSICFVLVDSRASLFSMAFMATDAYVTILV